MITKKLRVRITGRSPAYQVQVEIEAVADSIAHLRECLQSFAPDVHLTTSEVQADLARGGAYECRLEPASRDHGLLAD